MELVTGLSLPRHLGEYVGEKPVLPIFQLERSEITSDWNQRAYAITMSKSSTHYPVASSEELDPLVIEAAPPYALVRSRHGLMLVNRNDFYIGQALIQYGEYVEAEVEFLSQFISHPGIVVEVGANIGSHTVPLARCAAATGGEMVVFEPQPFVFQNLCANLALNGISNVRAWPLACAAQAGTVWFVQPNYKQPGNFGAVPMQTEAKSPGLISAPCVQLDSVLGDSEVTLIKLDVEGFELSALQGALQVLQRSRPTLYLENDQVKHSRELIEWLWAQEYRLWWHVCPLYSPENFRGKHEDLYPNISSFNMLALPRESGITAPGFVEIVDAGYHPLTRN